MRCPDHDVALGTQQDRLFPCARCGGAAIPTEVLEATAPAVVAALAVESNERSAAFRQLRRCPQCTATMAPHRFGPEGAWLEKCAACGLFWADAADRKLLRTLGRQAAREAAFRTLDESERRELASSLAASARAKDEPPLTSTQTFLAFFGIPSLLDKEGTREPRATWFLIAVLVAVHVLGRVFPATFGAEVLAYDSVDGTWATAFSSVFAHAGWMHLLGNVTFFAAFGDGLEQRLPRIGYLLLFGVSGALAALAQAFFSDGPTSVLGASGAIATVLGACVMLQPRARVLYTLWTPAGVLPLRIPILIYGLFELGWQVFMMSAGGSGIAWTAHVTGLAVGFAVGFAIRKSRELVPDEAPAPEPVPLRKTENVSGRSPWR